MSESNIDVAQAVADFPKSVRYGQPYTRANPHDIQKRPKEKITLSMGTHRVDEVGEDGLMRSDFEMRTLGEAKNIEPSSFGVALVRGRCAIFSKT